jgi:hypothetical protein
MWHFKLTSPCRCVTSSSLPGPGAFWVDALTELKAADGQRQHQRIKAPRGSFLSDWILRRGSRPGLLAWRPRPVDSTPGGYTCQLILA